ncbi:MAG: flagellar biosynthetic protein FliQ, partial [Pirellulales bacterium]|nr:flagellar biosynthetic protein FliQ [Pirellulales bacterium]
MSPQDAIELTRQALFETLLLCAPVLTAGLVVGLVIGLLQALTQVQEQTIAFVPKLVAMFAVLLLALPWLITTMV